MNLLEKAKVITTPTAYSEGKLHSVKPEIVLGPELVTNGDFATDSNWTKGTGWTISGGKANCDGSQSAQSNFYQVGIVPINIYYQVTFTATVVSGGVTLAIGGSNAQPITTASGTYTVYSKATSGDSNLYFSANSTFVGSIDNVSVKEDISADFDFTRNSSATRVGADGYIQDVQIIGGELVQNGDFEEIGSELVVNGSFATDSDWNKGTGWSISGGVSTANNVPNLQRLQNTGNAPSVIGSTYKYSIDVSNVSGFYSLYIYGVYALSTVNTEGTIEGYVTATSTNGAIFVAASSAGGLISATIDNVSVKEVGQNWTFATGWSMGDGKAVYNDVNTSKIYQNISLTQNNKYRIQFTISDASTYAQMWIANATGNIGYLGSGYVQYTNGTYVTDFVMPSNQTTLAVWSTTGGSSFKLDNVSVKEVTDATNLPRINYENGIGHLLLEGQSTNNLSYSENFATNWVTYVSTISTDNSILSPDGETNGTLVSKNGQSYARIEKGSLALASSTYTFSVFAKKGLTNWVKLRIDGTSAVEVSFDLENGVVGSNTGATTATTEDYGNGWYRCTIVFINSVTICRLYVADNDGGWGNTNAASAYFWGAQLEQGNISSYIPTNGSAVTRAAETCNNAGNADLFDSEGVLYAEIAALANDGARRRIYLSDNTSSNRVMISYDTGSNAFRCFVIAAGVQSFDIKVSVTSILDFHKIAIRFKENDFSLWIDGEQLATGTSGSEPTGLNDLSFDALGAFNFYGKTKMVAVFPYLSDDELECLTGEGYGSFEAMALANNYTIIQG